MTKNYQLSRLSFGMVLLALMIVGTAMADARNVEQARQAAMQQMKKNTAMKAPGKGGIVAVNPQLVYSKAKQGDEAYYYVFSAGNNNGFTVVSGDDRLPAIVGYTESGEFNADSMPDGLAYFMEAYQNFVDNATDEQIKEAVAWKSQAKHAAVAPFMQEKWNQWAPYNNQCPKVQGSDDPCVTGCVATAVAQILHHWKTPVSLQAEIPAYTTRSYGIEMPAIAAGETYDWANMLNEYSGSATDLQKEAVAKLMLHVGCAVEMDYAPAGSGAAASVETFTKYFGMDADFAQLKYRSSYDIAEWDKMLYGEMDAKHPVYYSGSSTGGGHAFVIHGYDDGMYYVNWGWGGYCDGYYDITLLNPGSNVGAGASSSDDGYSMNNNMIIGIQPDNGMVDDVMKAQLCQYETFTLSNLVANGGKLTATASLHVYNQESVDLKKYISVGYVDDAGNIVNVGTPKNFSFPAAKGNGVSVVPYGSCHINFEVEDGKVYKLVVIESVDQRKWLQSGIYNGEKFVAVKVSAGKAEIVDLKTELSATVGLNEKSNGYAGLKNTVDVTVSNAGGKEYYSYVYVRVNNTDVMPERYTYVTGITAPVNGSTTFNFELTPKYSGTYYFWILDDRAQEIGKGQIAFKDKPADPELSIVSVKCKNVSDETVAAPYLSGDTSYSMTMNKVKDTKAEFEFVIKNDGGYYEGDFNLFNYAGTESWPHFYAESVSIPNGSQVTISCTIEGNVGDVVGASINAASVDLKGLTVPIRHDCEGDVYFSFNNCEIVYLAGISDGINDAVNDANDNGVIYNLRGEKVTAPGKGIYIKNGKKIVFK